VDVRHQHTSAYVSIRQHTSAYVSIRQHTSAYVSIPVRAVDVRHQRLFSLEYCDAHKRPPPLDVLFLQKEPYNASTKEPYNASTKEP
jgi:hypothetical protein